MKKIIVTGITGSIGQYLISPLKELEFDIYGIGTRNFTTDKFHYIKQDINDYVGMEKVFKEIKAEYLIHLAWNLSQGYFNSNINFDMLTSSFNILKFFKKNGGKKAVYAGTYAEYSFDKFPAKEYDNLKPNNIYAKCKNYLRELSELYCNNNNINFCWTRIFNTYGINDNETRLLPYIINSLKNNKKVYIKHSHLIKDYIYAGDVAKILALIINSNINGIINICSGKGIKLKDLALIIEEKLCKKDLLIFNELDTEEPPIAIGDNTRIINELNFFNYSNFDEIIDNIINNKY